MSFMGGIFKALGFEGEKKVKTTKSKTKASYKFKNKRGRRTDQIDGVPVYYPENLEMLKSFLEFVKQKKAVIISFESCDKNDGIMDFLHGFVFGTQARSVLLNDEDLYLILPEGMEIEE